MSIECIPVNRGLQGPRAHPNGSSVTPVMGDPFEKRFFGFLGFVGFTQKMYLVVNARLLGVHLAILATRCAKGGKRPLRDARNALV